MLNELGVRHSWRCSPAGCWCGREVMYCVRICQGLGRGRPVPSRGGNEPAPAYENQRQNFLRDRRDVAVSKHADPGLLQHTRHSQLCGCELVVQRSENCLDVDRDSAVEVEKSFPPHWPKKGMMLPTAQKPLCADSRPRLATKELTTSCSAAASLVAGGPLESHEAPGLAGVCACIRSCGGICWGCCGTGTGSGLGCCSCRGCCYCGSRASMGS